MDIGDKIRLLHGQEEGIIRRFIDNKTVEVEIEDGFLIPVLKNEVVTIAREESERFNKEIRSVSSEIDLENSNLLEEQSEIFLAIETRNIEINLWLINQTINTLLFTVHTVSAEQFHGLSYGILRKYTYSKIDTWNLKDQGQWPILMIDIISYQEKSKNPGIKISKRLTINKNHVLKTKERAPLLNLNARLIPLSDDIKPINPEDIKKAFFSDKNYKRPQKDKQFHAEDEVVDLHIESLIKDHQGLSNEEILKIQIDHFEKRLENAIIKNIRSITFIHGIGNGTLRHRIHKFLSLYPHIKYFEDSHKEKFGYGATKVILQ